MRRIFTIIKTSHFTCRSRHGHTCKRAIHFNNIPHHGAFMYLEGEGHSEINSSGLSELRTALHKETLSSKLSFNVIGILFQVTRAETCRVYLDPCHHGVALPQAADGGTATNMEGKGKAVPLQAWSGPESSRKLRFPDFVTTAQDSGKVVSLTHRPPLPPGNTPGTHFC